jgi:hypothetical protein
LLEAVAPFDLIEEHVGHHRLGAVRIETGRFRGLAMRRTSASRLGFTTSV